MYHYVSLLPGNDSQATMTEVLVKTPNILGFLKRYQWVDLEPQRDVYNLTEIEADRAFLASKGKTLTAMIEDKTFQAGVSVVPAYVTTVPCGNGDKIGLAAVRWNRTNADGFLNLLAVIGKRFGRKTGFRGIATQETAPGLTATQYSETGYNADAYGQYYIDISNVLASCETKMYFHANFIPQNQAELTDIQDRAAHVLQFGGPDLWPDSYSLNKQVYPYYVSFQGPKFIGVSMESYRDYTMTELLTKANQLGVTELFWQYVPAFTKAIATINKG